MLPSETMIWQPEFTDKILSRKPGAVQTKTKGAFPNENSVLKLLYLGLMNAQEKWTMPIQIWNLTLSQLAIYFEGRLNNVMTL